jgi:hypothetical protein
LLIPVTGAYHSACRTWSLIETRLSVAIPSVTWSAATNFGLFYDSPGPGGDTKCRALLGKVVPEEIADQEIGGITIATLPDLNDAIQMDYSFRGLLAEITAIKRVYLAISTFWDGQPKGPADPVIAEFSGLKPGFITYVQGFGSYSGILSQLPFSSE